MAGRSAVRTPEPAAPVRPRRRNAPGEGAALRGEIVDAVLRLLERSSASELSMRGIAREAGVSATALYLHFPNQAQILAEAVRGQWSALAEAMRRADRRAAGRSPRERLLAQIRAYIRYTSAGRARYEILFGFQNRYLDAASFDRAPTAEVFAVLRTAVRRMLEGGSRSRVGGEVDTTLHILSVLHGRVAMAHSAPGWRFSTPRGISAFVEDVVGRVLIGPPGPEQDG